jgi:hypothetical protein
MTMMNWPPSRGPNPHIPQVRYVPGMVERVDVLRAALRTQDAEEEAAIKEASDDVEFPSSDGGDEETSTPETDDHAPYIEVMRKPREPKVLSGEFSCSYHVATVVTLSIEQASRLLEVRKVIRREDATSKTSQGRTYKKAVHDDHSTQWAEYETRSLIVTITYPLSLNVRLTIAPLTEQCTYSDHESEWVSMSPGYLMWVLAQEYRRIYVEHEKYGVWGHDIDDLHFEGFAISENGDTELWIGS